MVQGMQGLVRQTRQMYAGGIDSQRLVLKQSLATIEGGQGPVPRMDESSLPPTVKVMQRQTLLIIITFEVSIPATSKQIWPVAWQSCGDGLVPLTCFRKM